MQWDTLADGEYPVELVSVHVERGIGTLKCRVTSGRYAGAHFFFAPYKSLIVVDKEVTDGMVPTAVPSL